MNRIKICKEIIQSIKEYITNPDKLEPHKASNHFVRKRKLSILGVIYYLLFSSKASMFQNIADIKMCLPDINFPTISKQALSKARQYISPDLFKELFYLSVDTFYKNVPSRKTWNGYHVFAIDGSKIELPNSKSNFDFFGEMFGYPDPSRRFTMGLASIVYDVLDDYIVHASFHRYLASERSAAKEHLEQLEALNIFKNSIVIFDRGYYSEAMLRYCIEHNHICLMRLKEKINLCKSCKGDTITTIPGDKKLTSLIKNQADDHIDHTINAKSTNKYRYQANRAFIIGQLKRVLPKLIIASLDISYIDLLLENAISCRSQIIDGRKFKRKKNKPY